MLYSWPAALFITAILVGLAIVGLRSKQLSGRVLGSIVAIPATIAIFYLIALGSFAYGKTIEKVILLLVAVAVVVSAVALFVWIKNKKNTTPV